MAAASHQNVVIKRNIVWQPDVFAIGPNLNYISGRTLKGTQYSCILHMVIRNGVKEFILSAYAPQKGPVFYARVNAWGGEVWKRVREIKLSKIKLIWYKKEQRTRAGLLWDCDLHGNVSNSGETSMQCEIKFKKYLNYLKYHLDFIYKDEKFLQKIQSNDQLKDIFLWVSLVA